MNLLTSVLNLVTASALGQVFAGSLFASNKVLCFRLLWMARNDQQARQAFLNGKPGNDQIDRHNTQMMKKIVARYGWPGEKLVGQLGAQAAWLLAQHADHDRPFQKHCHSLLEEAVRRKDAQARHLAYLTDRVCVGEGLPQVYGTQLEYPIRDPEHVDERRAGVGLPSLAEYIETSRQVFEQIRKRKEH